ncbi:MAG: NAD(P)-dependent oxidoreductase [Pseudomonadota bacterium]
MSKMLRFVEQQRQPPQKRAPEARKADFDEIDDGLQETLGNQASRCSQCGVPFCATGCPLGNHIPDWLCLTAEGDYKAAYALSTQTSAMPEICGRICPQDRLCEKACVIEQSGHGTVTIGAVEKSIGDKAWDEGWVEPIVPETERPESIGIVGAGPAGLAAADRLRTLGYQVVIYDRYDRAGGLLTYGIPGFKLEKPVVMRRIDRLTDAGVKIVPNTDIGGDVSFAELKSRHDAVLIATGVYKARALSLPAPAGSVVPALDYLTASNRKGFGDQVPLFDDGTLNAEGKRVVVIGGGDTAMDCVRTAIRQGAKSVDCLYRRDRANMPGSAREVQHAEEEGVSFRWLMSPKAITQAAEGHTIRALQMRLGPKDRSGRQQPEETGREENLQADMIIAALGFEPEDVVTAFGVPSLEVSRWGTLKTDPRTFATQEPGVIAAGDIVRGASLVVWAVHDGQKAAAGIHQFIQQGTSTTSRTLIQHTHQEAV